MCGQVVAGESTISTHNGWVTKEISMTGKTAIVTGCNSGIGYETALDFARRGARVILACRSETRAEDAKRTIIDATGCEEEGLLVRCLDLSSFASVTEFARQVTDTEERLDVLVNNAGVMMCAQSDTEDGFETHLQVNHLAPFLLTNLLLGLLKRSAPSRIVVLSSVLHWGVGDVCWDDINLRRDFDQTSAYYQSKLMNILFTRQLAEVLRGSGVAVFSVHPGIVKTNLTRHIESPTGNLLWKFIVLFSDLPLVRRLTWWDSTRGAQTSIYCSIAPEVEDQSGEYFSNCKVSRPSRAAQSDKSAQRLWEISEELTKLDERLRSINS